MKSPAVSFKGLSLKNIKSNNTLQPSSGTRPFRVMVHMKITDHIRSWRFIVLIALIVLTFCASMYVSLGNIRAAINNTDDPDHIFYT